MFCVFVFVTQNICTSTTCMLAHEKHKENAKIHRSEDGYLCYLRVDYIRNKYALLPATIFHSHNHARYRANIYDAIYLFSNLVIGQQK